jgi:hypothetical protein
MTNCPHPVCAAAVALLHIALAMPIVARAQDAATLTTTHLYAGTLAQGETELAALVQREPGNGEARFGLGGVRFVRAVARLAQSMYRHGLEAPRTFMVPMLRLPVPRNPNPAPLTYDGFRTILQQFADDLAQAEATLAPLNADVKLPIDLARVHLDLDGDGRVADEERLWSILGLVDARSRGSAPDTFVIAFDKGDVYWMRGYAHLLMAIAETWLAHDFRPTFEQTFHLFFPRAGLPYAAPLGSERRGPDSADYPVFADALAFIHLFNWPVVDGPRLQRVHAHFKAVATMSRQSWAAILAETDDDREWIPNPRQGNPFPSLPVTQERIEAWLGAMTEFEAVLDGVKLVPHWRFRQGINFKRALLEHKTLDPVMWITGAGVVPFLEDGPIATTDAWNGIVGSFQGNFFGYAMWFN